MLVIICLNGLHLEVQAKQISTFPKDTTLTKQTGDSLLNVVQKDDSITINPKKQAIEIPIKYNAKDSIVYDIVKSKVYLYNKAEVYYGDISLKADYVVIDQIKKTVYVY